VSVGIAGAPTYWFLFAAAYARKTEWTTGWRLVLAHGPLAYSLVITLTNPLHRLFVDQVRPGAPTTYGPLAVPYQIGMYSLVIVGIWLVVTSSWRRGTRYGRRQALVLGIAAMAPLAGGLAWALRARLGLPLTVNPTPALFTVLDLALAWELLDSGLGDVVPYATSQAFNAISDGAVAVDEEAVVVALNRAASALFPTARVGLRLHDAAPELADAIETSLHSAIGYIGFDVEFDGLLYWARVRRTTDRRGVARGCVILLTDVTEVRDTQAKLAQLTQALDEEFFVPRGIERTTDRRRGVS
jgi:PAS domain-containing protein